MFSIRDIMDVWGLPHLNKVDIRPVLKFNNIVEIPYRVLNFNTGRDPRFKAPQKSFPEILNLESWIRSSIEVQHSVLNFNAGLLQA